MSAGIVSSTVQYSRDSRASCLTHSKSRQDTSLQAAKESEAEPAAAALCSWSGARIPHFHCLRCLQLPAVNPMSTQCQPMLTPPPTILSTSCAMTICDGPWFQPGAAKPCLPLLLDRVTPGCAWDWNLNKECPNQRNLKSKLNLHKAKGTVNEFKCASLRSIFMCQVAHATHSERRAQVTLWSPAHDC